MTNELLNSSPIHEENKLEKSKKNIPPRCFLKKPRVRTFICRPAEKYVSSLRDKKMYFFAFRFLDK